MMIRIIIVFFLSAFLLVGLKPSPANKANVIAPGSRLSKLEKNTIRLGDELELLDFDTSDAMTAENIIGRWIQDKQRELNLFVIPRDLFEDFLESAESEEKKYLYLKGLLRLTLDPRHTVKMAAIHFLWHLCKYPPDDIDLSMELFSKAIGMDREGLDTLINDTLMNELDLPDPDSDSLMVLEEIGSAIELPEVFFKKIADIIAAYGNSHIGNEALVSLTRVIMPRLSLETQRAYLSAAFKNADFYVKAMVLRHILYPLSGFQIIDLTILRDALTFMKVSAHSRFAGYKQRIVYLLPRILANQASFGVFPEGGTQFILDVLKFQIGKVVLQDNACTALGEITRALKQHGRNLQLNQIKDSVLSSYSEKHRVGQKNDGLSRLLRLATLLNSQTRSCLI